MTDSQKTVELDAEQQAAAHAFMGAFRVDACAGSGKTTTLVARYRFLKDEKAIPENEILGLTFTRNAAEEMRGRAKATKGTLRTLHSWALAAVTQEVQAFRPQLRSFPLLTDTLALVTPILRRYDLRYKDLLGYISNCKRQGKTPREMLVQAETDPARAMAQAYEEYQSACRRECVLDFDSIIWELVLLFERRPDVCDRHQIRFLMVDEAQDCSEMDWRLIRQITQRYGNVWVVGDYAQSVYSFRGASPHIFAAFADQYPNVTVLPLGTCYRSQAKIVEYSQKVMPEQTSYLDNWKASRPAGTENVFQRFDNDFTESQWILEKVVSGQCPPATVAILARTNAQLAVIQGFCAEKGVPYKLLGKDNFWKRPEVLAILGLVKNAVGVDDVGLKQAIQSPLPCLRFLNKSNAVAALEAAQTGVWSNRTSGESTPLKHLLTRVNISSSADSILFELHGTIQEASKYSGSPTALVRFLTERTGVRELADDDDSAETFVQDNIRKVVGMAARFSSVSDFVTFARTAGHPSRKRTRLILSTVHGFKGLEAPNVFVIGVNLDVFPHKNAELQEEKRLYYVAVSRPADALCVSCSGIPSPFIEPELKEESAPRDPWKNSNLGVQGESEVRRWIDYNFPHS